MRMLDDQVKYRLKTVVQGDYPSVLKDLKHYSVSCPSHTRMSLMEGFVFFTLKEKATRTHFSQFSFNAQNAKERRQRPELSKFSLGEDWYPSFGKHSAVDGNLSPWSGKAEGG